MTTPRRRILQVSYKCDPASSMESRLGWRRALGAAAEFDTWVICADENRDNIERYQQANGKTAGLTFCYVDSAHCNRHFCEAPGRRYRAYHDWHRRVLGVAEELHRSVGFDLTHQIGLCGYREPGYLWRLDTPFVWGPVGGAQDFPWRYLPLLNLRSGVYETIRTLANRCQLRFRKRVRLAAERASKIFVANSTTQREFQRVLGVSTELQLETGIDVAPRVQPEVRQPEQPLRILWAGRFRPWKALPLLLRALRGLDQEISYQLRIMGHERGEAECRRLAKRFDLEPHIEWVGWPPYSEMLTHYQWADVFAFTSLRDTSGTGLLEALMYGCPIVGMDHQGAHDVMTSQCAIPIPVTSPRESAQGFRDAFIALANDPDRLESLSRGARQRAFDFTWSNHNRRMLDVYRSILKLDTSWDDMPSPACLEAENGSHV